jgi:hypothetical protein
VCVPAEHENPKFRPGILENTQKSCYREVAMTENNDQDVLSKVLGEKVFTDLIAILSTLQFGSVSLIVQNGKVVQIEKNEKFRLV